LLKSTNRAGDPQEFFNKVGNITGEKTTQPKPPNKGGCGRGTTAVVVLGFGLWLKMNWLQKIAQIQPQIFWHASPAHLADDIISSGFLKPNSTLEEETGSSHAGWNFKEQVGYYGDGVYLASTAELALYYADLRLRSYREEIESTYDYEEDEEGTMRYFEDDLEYLGLFRIYVLNTDNLVPDEKNEFKYRGIIPNQQNNDAWFEFIRWVSRGRDADEWRGKMGI